MTSDTRMHHINDPACIILQQHLQLSRYCCFTHWAKKKATSPIYPALTLIPPTFFSVVRIRRKKSLLHGHVELWWREGVGVGSHYYGG